MQILEELENLQATKRKSKILHLLKAKGNFLY
jgi:hypothetical protein